MQKKLCTHVLLLCIMGSAFWSEPTALEHPSIFLNKFEIEGIKVKVKAGQEPWKSAFDKARSLGSVSKTFYLPEGYGHVWLSGSAQSSVENKYNYSYDYCRKVAVEFGVSLVCAAMAWHITGEQKYADWCKKNINSWFHDPATYMKPQAATVGLNASFSGVVIGVDLAWPCLGADLQAKTLEWFKNLHASVKAKPDGSVGGNHNRSDWWVSMSVLSGLMAGNTSIADMGMQHIQKRSVSQNGDISVGGSGEESRANYTYFAINALTSICEAVRHHGKDAYSEGGKMERLFDRYGRYYGNASLWQKETGNVPSKTGYFLGINFYPWELAYNFKGKPEYLSVINKVGRPFTDISNAGGVGNPFGNATLTHARGAYEFKVWGNSTSSEEQRTALSLKRSTSTSRIVLYKPGQTSSPVVLESSIPGWYGLNGRYTGSNTPSVRERFSLGR